MKTVQTNIKKVSTFRYALGMLGLQIPSQAFTVYLTFYYVETLNLAVGLAAIGRAIFSIWDAVDNILFGYLSDNTRTKWGRRRPWLMLALPFYLLFFILVYTVPDAFSSGNRLFWYFTIIIFLYETFATILWGNYGALFPELFQGKKKRARASGLKQIFTIIGTVIGIVLAPMVYKAFGFTWMAIIFGVIGCTIILYSVLGSHENLELAKKPKLPFVKAFKETLQNKCFWQYSLAYTFIQLVFGLLLAGLPFYAKYSLKLDDAKTTLLTASVFIIAIPSVFIWTKLINKWGASKTWLVGIVVMGLSIIPLALAYDLKSGIIAGMILGLGYCSVLVAGEVVTSEIIDMDAKKTGARREGIYLSVYGFIIRISGVLQGAAFALIGFLFGYKNGDNPGSNPGLAFKFLIVGLPLIALSIAFMIGLRYKKSSDAMLYANNEDGMTCQEVS